MFSAPQLFSHITKCGTPTIACCWLRYELCIQSSIINTWPSSPPTYPHTSSYPPMCNMDIDGWMNVHKCMSLNKPQCVVCYVNWFVKSVTNNIGIQQPMNQWDSQSVSRSANQPQLSYIVAPLLRVWVPVRVLVLVLVLDTITSVTISSA